MTMTVEGLDDAWMYEFRIKCANLIGESEPSIPLMVVIQDDEGETKCWERSWKPSYRILWRKFSGK